MAEMRSKKDGYTLVELLMVISILGLILPAIFSILIIILQQQARIYELSTVKREGDNILNLLKAKIANEATGVTDENGAAQCVDLGIKYEPNSSNNFKLKNKDSSFFYHHVNTDLKLNNNVLHSNRVTISDFKIYCYKKSDFSPIMVGLSYKVTFNRTTGLPSATPPSLDYQSRILLRNSI
jgi:prepilin-type N-terminal cleavage/methylation domain-containing protein